MFHKLLQNNVVDYLHISEIKKTDTQSHRFSFGRDNTLLSLSIKSAGILSPLLLKTNGSKCVTEIITGFRRLEAAASLGIEKIPCILIPSDKISPFNVFLISFYDNIATRGFNEVEKALIIRFLVENKIPYSDIATDYLPLLGIPPKIKYTELYFAVSNSSVKLKDALASERIGLKAFEKLLKLPVSCRSVIEDLMLKLKFNINQQSQLIDFIEIIINKNGEKNATDEITKIKHEIVESSFLSDPQKINAVLASLKVNTSPLFYISKKRFQSAVASIDIPANVKISHPPFFELSSYTMEINFSSGRELDNIFRQLQRQNIAEKLSDPLDFSEDLNEFSVEN